MYMDLNVNIYIYIYIWKLLPIFSNIYQDQCWKKSPQVSPHPFVFSHAGASNASSRLKEPGRKMLQKAQQSIGPKGCGGGGSIFNTRTSKTIAFGRKPAYESMKRSHTAESYIRHFAKRTLFCFWVGNSKLKIIKKTFLLEWSMRISQLL